MNDYAIRYLFRLMIFCTIFVCLVLLFRNITLGFVKYRKTASYLIADVKRSYTRDNLVLSPEHENVIFFGHSAILAGIRPEVFDLESNPKTHSWNLAMPALPISISYYLLRDMVENDQIPDYILLLPFFESPPVGNPFFSRYAVEGATAGDVLELCLLRQHYQTLLYYSFPIIGYKDVVKHEFLKELFRFPWSFAQEWKNRVKKAYEADFLFEYHYGNTQIINMTLVEEMIRQRGYYYIREQASAFRKRKIPPVSYLVNKQDVLISQRNISNYSPNASQRRGLMRDPYAEKFFDMAQKHNIKILLINAPLRKSSAPTGEGKQRKISPELANIISRYENVFMSASAIDPVFIDDECFSDGIHLYPETASEYTRIIAQQFALLKREERLTGAEKNKR